MTRLHVASYVDPPAFSADGDNRRDPVAAERYKGKTSASSAQSNFTREAGDQNMSMYQIIGLNSKSAE
jgi:hypothetical protein